MSDRRNGERARAAELTVEASTGSRDGNGAVPTEAKSPYPARAAVVDMQPAKALDMPVRRTLRLMPAVGAEGTGRKVTRHSKPFRDALGKLELKVFEAGLAEDALRDWCAAGLLAEAILQLLEDTDSGGKLWRHLFGGYCQLMRLKADRRSEFAGMLSRADKARDLAAAMAVGGRDG